MSYLEAILVFLGILEPDNNADPVGPGGPPPEE